MRVRSAATWSILMVLLGAACTAGRPPAPKPGYVFSWPFLEGRDMSPRGGTTRGGEVTLATGPSPAWKELQRAKTPVERDRAAILAMAGDYRASFDFLETVVFEPPFEPARPYRSWGTERVYVIEDRGDFVSLQHVLEMVFVDDEGNVQGPVVQKHWRQDWQYEPREIHEYVGRRHWRRRKLSDAERKGRWSQAVYQVDDTPRYASVGRWEHDASQSSWTGARTGRPLPRRESTVRDDYDLLLAENRHTILPSGWVHEEDNLKAVLPASGSESTTARAREVGVNRYDRLQGFDFGAADAYWTATRPLWTEVRRAWDEKLASSAEVDVATECDGKPVYVLLFEYADRLQGDEVPTAPEIRSFVDGVLACVTRPSSETGARPPAGS